MKKFEDAFERFNNPAGYLAEHSGSAIWRAQDCNTLIFKTCNEKDAVVKITSNRNDKYNIQIEKAGFISSGFWPEIYTMYEQLQQECLFHKMKRVVLHVPKPAHILIIYHDHTKSLSIYDDDRVVYELWEDGRSLRVSSSPPPSDSVKNYFHCLLIEIANA